MERVELRVEPAKFGEDYDSYYLPDENRDMRMVSNTGNRILVIVIGGSVHRVLPPGDQCPMGEEWGLGDPHYQVMVVV